MKGASSHSSVLFVVWRVLFAACCLLLLVAVCCVVSAMRCLLWFVC